MYDQIARYYDLTHADLTEDVPFILALAEEFGGPILELGCGSGRLLIPLARAGHQVVGLDNSAAMLALARARLAAEPTAVQKRITLVEADMTKFELTGEYGRFPLVIIPYNTFMHLNSQQKMVALKRIKPYLRADGRLFIDLINPFAIAQTPDDDDFILENSFAAPETGQPIQQYARNQLDEDAQILNIIWAYDEFTADGDAVQRTTIDAAYHFLYPHQLDLLLNNAGYQLQTLAGDYDNIPFTAESDRLLLLAS